MLSPIASLLSFPLAITNNIDIGNIKGIEKIGEVIKEPSLFEVLEMFGINPYLLIFIALLVIAALIGVGFYIGRKTK